MAARVKRGTSIEFDIPHALFATGLEPVTDFHAYDVSRDGRHFLVPVFTDGVHMEAITVMTNWTAKLSR